VTSRFLVLSHPLSSDAPVWPGNPPAAAIEAFESISRGDVANTTRLHLFSHSGTHVDTPWHFDPDGPAASQLPIEAFVFERPRLIDLRPREGGFIGADDLTAHASSIATADLVLLWTGWSEIREVAPERYVTDGPLLHPDAARWLVDRYPDLRAVATDGVSIGSPRFPTESVATHHALFGFGRSDGRFVLILEDVRIVAEVATAVRVYAWPLFVEGSDGSPVTIVAELP
jgi:kynurenine formamidase